MTSIDDFEARKRGPFLSRELDIDDRVAKALAYRHLGYSHAGIARKLGVTEGTAENWMDRIADEYGVTIVETKWREQREAIGGWIYDG